MKRFIAFILSFLLVICMVQPSFADYGKNETNTESSAILRQNIDSFLLLKPVTPDDPYAIPNVDYSTGIYQYIELPLEKLAAISIVLASRFVKQETIKTIIAAINATIIGLHSDDQSLYLEYTQYSSKDSYYSNYTNTYYHKAINLGICIYAVSRNGRQLICGPYDGNWFDPVRP